MSNEDKQPDFYSKINAVKQHQLARWSLEDTEFNNDAWRDHLDRQWGITEEQWNKAVAQLRADDPNLPPQLLEKKGEVSNVSPYEAALFLYARGLVNSENEKEEDDEDEENDDDGHVEFNSGPELVTQLLCSMKKGPMAARQRLLRVLQGDKSKPKEEMPENVQRFEEALAALSPAWDKGNGCFILIRDHKSFEGFDKIVQRVQRSRLCYAHAPVVTQHYCVAKNTDNGHKMADVAAFVRAHLSSDRLYDHIINNHGGQSSALLKDLLQKDSVVAHHPEPPTAAQIREILENHGPLLVARFEVYPDFRESDCLSYSEWQGPKSGKRVGWHSMTLLGVRTAQDGTPFYLIQNWWERKQFLEVSHNYLKASNAELFHVATDQTGYPDKLELNESYFVETTDYPAETVDFETNRA